VDRAREPEKLAKREGLLSRIATAVPRRVYALAVGLALAGATGVTVYSSIKNTDKITQGPLAAVDPEHDPILQQTHNGDWDFLVYRTADAVVDGSHGNTLYHFIKGTLQDKGLLKDLTDQDKAYYVDGFIQLVKDLNPGVSVDDFGSVNGKTLHFPDYVLAKTHFAEPLSKDHGGYSRLQDMAEADGYPVTDIALQQSTYDNSVKEAVDIPDSSDYRHKNDGRNASVLKLKEDVIPQLEDMGKRFKAKPTSRGAGFIAFYTDVMRSPALNAETKGSSKGTTHTTPRTLDLANGRFLRPDGTEFTFSIDDPSGAVDGNGNPKKIPGPDAEFIEKELQPALTAAALEAGFLLFQEGTHWHLYAPENHTLELHLSEKVAMPPVAPGPRINRSEAQTAYEAALDKMLLNTVDRVEQVDAAKNLKALDKIVTRVVGHGSSRFHAVLCTDTAEISELIGQFGAQSLEDLQLKAEVMLAKSALEQAKTSVAHLGKKVKEPTKARIDEKMAAIQRALDAGKSWEDLASATEALDEELKKIEINIQNPGTDEFKTLTRVRNALLREKLITVTRSLNDDQIVNNHIFDGSVVSRYADIEAAWRYKKDFKGGAVVDKYYPYLHMEGKNHTLPMRKWYERQQAASVYLKAHGAELGYPQDLLDYMSPSLMLSVVHAEMFSEFSGETFVDLAPVLFSAHNLVYGPALNDHELSGGFVQMIYGTFKGLLHNHGAQITALREKDPSYLVIVPPIRSYTDKVKITVGRGRNKRIVTKDQTVEEYDREKFPQAMLTDVDSQLFYDQLAILTHITPGMKVLLADAKFALAWKEASEKDRYLLLGSFSAMAINAGPGSEKYDNGAYKIAKLMLESVNSMALSEYREAIAPACKKQYGNSAKATTTSRNALRGFETMDVLVGRVEVEEPGLLARLENLVTAEPVPTPAPIAPTPIVRTTPGPVQTLSKVPIVVTGDVPRAPLYKDYSALRDRAVADGYALSEDSDDNQKIYEAALASSIPVPDSPDYFRKEGQQSEARAEREAAIVFAHIARQFKNETGGYIPCYSETLQSPEYRATVSSVSDATFYTGRTLAVPNGRFRDPSGKEITVSIPDPKHKGKYLRGPDADKVEALRKTLVKILEEFQAEDYVVVVDMSETGGGYQLYFPKQEKPLYGPDEASIKLELPKTN
jgi:hypothetical protein